jgi:hypothetical protein
MNQGNQSQRQMTEQELHAFEWRIREMLEKGESPQEVNQKLVAAGLTEASAQSFVEAITRQETVNRKNKRSELIGSFVAFPIMGIGFLLVIGNITGIFPTFPYAGFLVIISGIVIGAIVGGIASLTVK